MKAVGSKGWCQGLTGHKRLTCLFQQQQCTEQDQAQAAEGLPAKERFYLLQKPPFGKEPFIYETLSACRQGGRSLVRHGVFDRSYLEKEGFLKPKKSAVQQHASADTSNSFERSLRALNYLQADFIGENGHRKDARLKASQLVDRFAVEGEGGALEELLGGTVVDAYKGSARGKPLIIIYLDRHDSAEIQEEIKDAVVNLNLQFLGLENLPAQRKVQRGNVLESGESICSLSGDGFIAGYRVACEIGRPLPIFGVDDENAHSIHTGEALFFEEKTNALAAKLDPTERLSAVQKELCGFLLAARLFADTARIRSKVIGKEMLQHARRRGFQRMGVVIGAAHLPDLQKFFQQKGVSYIALAVPTLWKAKEQIEINSAMKRVKELVIRTQQQGQGCD